MLGQCVACNAWSAGHKLMLRACACACACAREQWEKYLACSHRPDPSKDTDINTFLSEQHGNEEPELVPALKTCQYTSEIISELEDVSALALEQGDDARVASCAAFRRQLFDLVTDKQDRATAAWLQNARSYASRDKPFEARVTSQQGTLKYGLWVNLGLKNIRCVARLGFGGALSVSQCSHAHPTCTVSRTSHLRTWGSSLTSPSRWPCSGWHSGQYTSSTTTPSLVPNW